MPVNPIRIYDLGSVVLSEYERHIHTRYHDGSENVFAPPLDADGNVLASFIEAANEMGYSNPMRYAVEHELAHHITAFAQGKQHSAIVWDAAHHVRMSLSEPHRASEEHLVNRLQRYMNLGAGDPYGCLEATHGTRLPCIALDLLRVARPWLK